MSSYIVKRIERVLVEPISAADRRSASASRTDESARVQACPSRLPGKTRSLRKTPRHIDVLWALGRTKANVLVELLANELKGLVREHVPGAAAVIALAHVQPKQVAVRDGLVWALVAQERAQVLHEHVRVVVGLEEPVVARAIALVHVSQHKVRLVAQRLILVVGEAARLQYGHGPRHLECHLVTVVEKGLHVGHERDELVVVAQWRPRHVHGLWRVCADASPW